MAMTTTAAKRDSMDITASELEKNLKITSASQNGSTPKPTSKATFTSLPPPVRNRIYQHVLDTEFVNMGEENVSYKFSIKNDLLKFTASRPPFPVTTALFYVNKLIGSEALDYFYSKNLFIRLRVFSSDARHAKAFLEDSGLLFSTSTLSENSVRHAMDLTIREKDSEQKRAVTIFPAQYLPRLINFLEQASRTTKKWTSARSLSIAILNTYKFGLAKLQGDLLELFRTLSGFGKVDISAQNVLPGYAEALESNLKTESFTKDMFLEVVSDMAKRADEAHDAQDWELAHQHARSVIITLTFGYLTRAELLHMQPDTFHKAIQRLRWRSELLVGKSLREKHLKTISSTDNWLSSNSIATNEQSTIAKDLIAAETATSQALSLAVDSPSPNSNPWFQTLPAELIPPNKAEWFNDEERAMSWFTCGLVHLALKENLFASGDFERACGLFPEGKEFVKPFEEARDGIDWNTQPGTWLEKASRLARE